MPNGTCIACTCCRLETDIRGFGVLGPYPLLWAVGGKACSITLDIINSTWGIAGRSIRPLTPPTTPPPPKMRYPGAGGVRGSKSKKSLGDHFWS